MIYVLIYQIFVVWLGLDNAKRIASDKKIYHGLNGFLHCGAGVIIGWLSGWQNGVALLFLTRVVFDVSLNAFRGLPLDYIPSKPISLIDRLEAKIWGKNGYTPKIVYLIISVCLLLAK